MGDGQTAAEALLQRLANTPRPYALASERGTWEQDVADVQAEARAELQATFDLRWKADMRAIKAWQAAHPGKELVWPDHADLVVWLLGEVERGDRTERTLLTEVEARQRLFPELGDELVGSALLHWYDTTHGNSFGHDHHCPVDRGQPADTCTCGWTEVLKAEERRDQLQTGAVV